MEKDHEEQLANLEKKYTADIERLEQSEAMHKTDARELRIACDELTQEKKEEEKKREQIVQEYSKNMQKHEEEVQLRLFFE